MFCFQLQSNSPSEATLNALGCYLLVSLSFVLVTMIEFAIVLLLKRKLSDTLTVSTQGSLSVKHGDENGVISMPTHGYVSSSFAKYQNNISLTDKIDFASLCISLTSYLLFNIAYFIHYTCF